MADKLGPVFMLRLGVIRVLVVSTCEAAKECFTTNDQALSSRPTYAAGKYLGYDFASFAFSPYRPYWCEVRKIATVELLSSRQLDLLKHVRAAEINLCMKELEAVLCQEHWGDDDEARRFQKAILEFFHLAGMILLSDSLPFLKWLDLGGYKSAMKKTAKEMDSIMGSWLEEHRRMRLSGDVDGREEFIHVMLSTLEGAKLSADYDQDTIFKALPLVCYLRRPPPPPILLWI
ncbi:hypothetical protein AAC387_Pa03g3320 [Persea americana]